MFAFPFVVALAGSFCAAITDVRQFKVYNRLSFPLLISGVLYHFWLNGSEGLLHSLGGLSVPFLLLFPVYLCGIMGAGDVKFASAIGAWLGLTWIVPVLVVGALCSGIYSISLILFSDGAKDAWLNFCQLWFGISQIFSQGGLAAKFETIHVATQRVDRRRRLVPFSAMNAVGVLLTFIWYAAHGAIL